MSERANLDPRQVGASRFLTVSLGQEVYGINAMRVREIIRPTTISPVPRSPKHILGVINLRGKVLPVLDLRIKLDLAFTGETDRTCIVVIESGKDSKLTGLMVDEAREVVMFSREEIEEPPGFGTSLDVSFISGLAKSKDSLIILLDIDCLLDESQPAELA